MRARTRAPATEWMEGGGGGGEGWSVARAGIKTCEINIARLTGRTQSFSRGHTFKKKKQKKKRVRAHTHTQNKIGQWSTTHSHAHTTHTHVRQYQVKESQSASRASSLVSSPVCDPRSTLPRTTSSCGTRRARGPPDRNDGITIERGKGGVEGGGGWGAAARLLSPSS